MDYQVSAKIQKLFDDVTALPEVQKALDFIEKDADNSIAEQIELTEIESPTFHEETRAKAYCQKLAELGLQDCHIDDFGNAVGLWKGKGNGPKILVEAHMDTVFPFGSVTKVRRENDVLYAPGIVDDTRGLAVLLSALRGLKASGLETAGDIVFVGTSREEGMGSLGGMKDFLDDNWQDIGASVSIDGGNMSTVTFEATGFKTYEVNFYGIGGHAYGAFGLMANPLHAAARAVAKIADFQVPEDPRTTFCVSNFHAGNDAGVHAIVPKATIKFNFRSNSQQILDELNDRIFKAIQEACDEETARWGKDAITWERKYLATAPAGTQDVECSLCQAMYHVCEEYDTDPKFGFGGCTNASYGIAHGIPSICIGRQFVPRGMNIGSTAHQLNENMYIKDYYKCVQMGMLVTLMMTGTPETPSAL